MQKGEVYIKFRPYRRKHHIEERNGRFLITPPNYYHILGARYHILAH